MRGDEVIRLQRIAKTRQEDRRLAVSSKSSRTSGGELNIEAYEIVFSRNDHNIAGGGFDNAPFANVSYETSTVCQRRQPIKVREEELTKVGGWYTVKHAPVVVAGSLPLQAQPQLFANPAVGAITADKVSGAHE